MTREEELTAMIVEVMTLLGQAQHPSLPNPPKGSPPEVAAYMKHAAAALEGRMLVPTEVRNAVIVKAWELLDPGFDVRSRALFPPMKEEGRCSG